LSDVYIVALSFGHDNDLLIIVQCQCTRTRISIQINKNIDSRAMESVDSLVFIETLTD